MGHRLGLASSSGKRLGLCSYAPLAARPVGALFLGLRVRMQPQATIAATIIHKVQGCICLHRGVLRRDTTTRHYKPTDASRFVPRYRRHVYDTQQKRWNAVRNMELTELPELAQTAALSRGTNFKFHHSHIVRGRQMRMPDGNAGGAWRVVCIGGGLPPRNKAT